MAQEPDHASLQLFRLVFGKARAALGEIADPRSERLEITRLHREQLPASRFPVTGVDALHGCQSGLQVIQSLEPGSGMAIRGIRVNAIHH